jgi:hypothetical protein
MSNVNVIGARKAAKTIARTQGITHQQALDRVAADRGFSHWGDLLATAGPAKPSDDASIEALVDLARSIGATSIHIEQTAVGDGTARMHSAVFMRIEGVRTPVHDSEGILSLRLGQLVCGRAGMPWHGFEAASGRLKLGSGLEVDVARTSLRMDENHARRISNVVLRLPWLHPAVAIDDLGERRGDGWGVVMSASSGLIVIGGKTNTMKTTLAHLVVEERRSGGMDTLLVDDVRDQDGLLAAIHASRGRCVVVVLHASGTGDVLARLVAIAGPSSLRDVVVPAIVGSRRLPRECGACGGAGCPSCEETGALGSGVLMVARKVEGTADLVARASVVDRRDDLPAILRLPAAKDAGESIRLADARASTLAGIDRLLGRMGRDMARAASARARSEASSWPPDAS